MANINISGQLHSTVEIQGDALHSHVVAGAEEILDESLEAKQSDINGSFENRINSLEANGVSYAEQTPDQTEQAQARENINVYSKNEVNQIASAFTGQNFVTVQATSGTTAADIATLINATGDGEQTDTIYRVAFFDGSVYDVTKYSEYVWNCTTYMQLNVRSEIEEIFDISVYNTSGGQAAVYDNLTVALAGVPGDVKRGGMSVKFIQRVPAKYSVVVTTSDTQPTGTSLSSASSVTSGTYEAAALTDFSTLPSATGSGNAVVYYYAGGTTYTVWTITMASAQGSEYVQYRLMTAAWSTTPTDWQGVDAEPTAGSRNLVESGGVVIGINQGLAKITYEIKSKNLFDKSEVIGDKVINTSGLLITISSWTYNKCTGLIPVEPNKYYCISGSTIGPNGPNIRCIASDGTTAMKVLAPASGTEYANSYNMPNANGTDTLNMLNGQFKTPANAAYVQFNVACNTNDSTNTIMLELVGDTYNPDFVPSAYEPYFEPVRIIKNDAIDMDETPVSESDKPVKSSGIYSAIAAVNSSLTEFEGHKVTEFGETPSDSNFPSEKLVYDKAVAPLGEVVEMKQSKNLFDKSDIVGDKIVSVAGALKNVGSYTYNKCTGWIPVKPNYYYRISGDTLSTGYYIRCANSDKSTVMKVLAPSTGTEYATDYNMPNSDGINAAFTLNAQFKTPANAAYVQFNIGVQNKDNTDTAMIEEVGSTYNPDFVPSSYEPYVEPYAVVKAEAIDTDNEPVENSVKPITSGGVYEALQEFTPITNKKLNVLLIGSSHGVNTISMFPVLAYHAGIDITVGNLYTGSATLGLYSDRPARQIPYMADHDVAFGRFAVYENGSWNTKSTRTIGYALSEYQWDAIILQRGATEDWWNENVSQFYQHLLDYIKEHCNGYTPKIYFNSGIADATGAVDKTLQIEATNILINTSKQQKAEYGIDIIPTAVAVQYARMTCLKNTGYGWVSGGTTYHDMSSDTQHLDTGIGQYVTGCTVFEKIVGDFFNMSVRELAYYPVYADVSGNVVNSGSQYFTAITDYYSRIAKQCAMLAVMDGEYVDDHAAYLTAKYASLPSTYTITNTLTGCTNSNDAVSISSDEVYMATLNVNTGMTMQSVEVTMGGVDVTSSVYAAYEGYYAIRIGVVSGNIVITASAS